MLIIWPQEELGEDPELESLYIMLDRVDVHCVWTSKKVLELLPNPLPEAPPGGVIVKEPGLGVFCGKRILLAVSYLNE